MQRTTASDDFMDAWRYAFSTDRTPITRGANTDRAHNQLILKRIGKKRFIVQKMGGGPAVTTFACGYEMAKRKFVALQVRERMLNE